MTRIKFSTASGGHARHRKSKFMRGRLFSNVSPLLKILLFETASEAHRTLPAVAATLEWKGSTMQFSNALQLSLRVLGFSLGLASPVPSSLNRTKVSCSSVICWRRFAPVFMTIVSGSHQNLHHCSDTPRRQNFSNNLKTSYFLSNGV